MTILIVTDVFPPRCGGSGWSTYALARALRERGHTVEIARAGAAPGPETPPVSDGTTPSYTYDDIPVHAFGRPGELQYRALRRGIALLARRLAPEVVHAQHVISCRALAGVNRRFLPRARTVCTVRDYWPVSSDGTRFNPRRQRPYRGGGYWRTLHSLWVRKGRRVRAIAPIAALYLHLRTRHCRWSLRRMDRVIAVSRFVADLLPVPPERVTVIPNMIDTGAGAGSPAGPRFSRRIVFAGKFNRLKGADIAAAVVASLPADAYTEAVFLGDGPLTETIRVRCPAARLPGHLPNHEVINLMAGSIVLLPARWDEPLGRTILEALSVGAIVVTTPTGGTTEIITDGVDGLLRPPDVAAMTAAVRGLLDVPEAGAAAAPAAAGAALPMPDPATLIAAARSTAARYDWRTVIPRYEALYTAGGRRR